MVNKYFEEVKLYFTRTHPGPESEHKKWYYIAPAISLGVVLLVIIIFATKRYLRRQRQSEANSLYTVTYSDQSSVDHIYQPVYKNQRNPIYLVPFSALPENFDFSRRDIIVRGDYIIIKDLLILEQPVIRPPSTPTTPTSLTPPTQIFLEEHIYKKQSPYNPNFY